MKILVTGGSGFLGQQLIAHLLAQPSLSLANGKTGPVTEIISVDQVQGALNDARVRYVSADISDPDQIRPLVAPGIAGIIHLAAVVSGTAERDFDLGMRVNLDGTRVLLEAARQLPQPVRFLFSSSLAVYGGTLPAVVDDTTQPTPQSSYGTQKLMGEWLVADYTRKGFVDGRSVRLPTVSVRPGKPNGAASSFASGIIREPMAGERSVCPIDPDTALWLISPEHAVQGLAYALQLPSEKLGSQRAVNLPGLMATPREMVDTLRRLAGDAVADRVDWVPDAHIKAIVDTWPSRVDTRRAESLGFEKAGTTAELVADYVRRHL